MIRVCDNLCEKGTATQNLPIMADLPSKNQLVIVSCSQTPFMTCVKSVDVETPAEKIAFAYLLHVSDCQNQEVDVTMIAVEEFSANSSIFKAFIADEYEDECEASKKFRKKTEFVAFVSTILCDVLACLEAWILDEDGDYGAASPMDVDPNTELYFVRAEYDGGFRAVPVRYEDYEAFVKFIVHSSELLAG